MGKRRCKNTPENFSAKIKAGAGTGDRESYKPWLSGHEFASKGAFVRMIGHTVQRQYVLLSHLESDVFRIYDHMDDVSDIKEQFPLPLAETLSISEELGIKHPYSDSYYNVITTDLLILKDEKWMGRAVKPSKDLNCKRVIEKLRIEQEWYLRKNLDWKIVTEKEINRELVKNIRWLYEDGADIDQLIPDQELLFHCVTVFRNLYLNDKLNFPDILEIIEEGFSLDSGTGMAIFKHMIRSKVITFDMESQYNPVDPRKPLERRGTTYGRYMSYSQPGHH